MANVTITYVEPTHIEDREGLPIASLFEPTGSYIDSDAMAGTVYDTNVPGNGEWEGLAAYMNSLSAHPGILLMFKKAFNEGTATLVEDDPITAQYYADLGNALAKQGFTVEVTEEATKSGN